MPQGLQVWDAQGQLQVDITTRMPKYIGSVLTGATNGSIIVPDFGILAGTPYFFVVALTASSTPNVFGPSVVINNNVISWTYQYPTRVPARIEYGIY